MVRTTIQSNRSFYQFKNGGVSDAFLLTLTWKQISRLIKPDIKQHYIIYQMDNIHYSAKVQSVVIINSLLGLRAFHESSETTPDVIFRDVTLSEIRFD